jgi:hypothetical protein
MDEVHMLDPAVGSVLLADSSRDDNMYVAPRKQGEPPPLSWSCNSPAACPSPHVAARPAS